MVLEFCAENFTDVLSAIDKGANRIELCDNLAVGGTTPSFGVIRQTVINLKNLNIPVMVMVRPRGGNFCFSETEFLMMQDDINIANFLGADGVVIGALKNNFIDERLFTLNFFNLNKTFHMAFDEIPPEKQTLAIDKLVEKNFHNILTHGGKLSQSIYDNIEHLKMLIGHSKRINIILGGSITKHNCQDLVKLTGAQQLHGTRIV